MFCKNCSYGCSSVDPIKLGDGKCQDEANVKQCLYDFGDCCQRIIDDSECKTCLCQHYGIKFPTQEKDVISFRLENANILENKRPINPNRLEHVIKGIFSDWTGELKAFRGKQTMVFCYQNCSDLL